MISYSGIHGVRIKPLRNYPVNKLNNEVRVCTNKTCRRQGSHQILQDFRDLVDPSKVEVVKSGCLGKCGDGPNVALLPSGLVLKHVNTTAHVARLVERQCSGGEGAASVFEAMQLKVQGNSAFQAGDADEAIRLYTQALQANPPYNQHLIFSNRSAIRLATGDSQGALEDADMAIQCSPHWAKGYIRKSDALQAMNEHKDALEALECALDCDVSLAESKEFIATIKMVREKALEVFTA